MVMAALKMSEEYDTLVMMRSTTRVCHSKSIVECGGRQNVPLIPYEKRGEKYNTVPANSRKRRAVVEERTARLQAFAEQTPFNFAEWHDKKVGVIASGVCYYYAKEVFGDRVSYLKLGFTWPLPEQKIRDFCSQVETVYVIEENDPYLEEAVRMFGFAERVRGKSVLPHFGELMPAVLRKAFLREENPRIQYDHSAIVPRPPAFCAGCPHRGFFYELGRRKDVVISGDIGCYALGYAEPYNAMDFNMCMGGAFSVGHGAQKMFSAAGVGKRVVAVLGDSTFFHTGMNSLLEVVYNGSVTVSVILDNAITGMTGHQNNPQNGLNARGEIAVKTSIEDVVRALGIRQLKVVNPNDLGAVRKALDWAVALQEPSVIITRWPCALKRITAAEKAAFQDPFTTRCAVDGAKCVGCKLCLACGCPALSFNGEAKKAEIVRTQCLGCGVCGQICPKGAISTEEKKGEKV